MPGMMVSYVAFVTDSFQNYPVFDVDPYALQLLLNFDEVKLCNPLGSKANRHKLGMFAH